MKVVKMNYNEYLEKYFNLCDYSCESHEDFVAIACQFDFNGNELPDDCSYMDLTNTIASTCVDITKEEFSVMFRDVFEFLKMDKVFALTQDNVLLEIPKEYCCENPSFKFLNDFENILFDDMKNPDDLLTLIYNYNSELYELCKKRAEREFVNCKIEIDDLDLRIICLFVEYYGYYLDFEIGLIKKQK